MHGKEYAKIGVKLGTVALTILVVCILIGIISIILFNRKASSYFNSFLF
jgi:hypothetical protein